MIELAREDVPSSQQVVALLTSLLKNVKAALKETEDRMDSEMGAVRKEAMELCAPLSGIEDRLATLVSKKNKQISDEWYKALNAECYKLEKIIAEILPFDPTGLETKWALVIHELHAKLDAIKPFTLVPFDVRDALESIDDEDEKLEFSAIRGSKKILEDIKKKSISQPGGGSKGIELSIDGVSKGTSQYVNIIGGAGITISYADVGQRRDVTISLSGPGGFAVLAVTGTLDDSNMTFTVASLPTLVIINGASYASTGGAITWAYVAGTLTLSSPVGVGGNIYSLG